MNNSLANSFCQMISEVLMWRFEWIRLWTEQMFSPVTLVLGVVGFPQFSIHKNFFLLMKEYCLWKYLFTVLCLKSLKISVGLMSCGKTVMCLIMMWMNVPFTQSLWWDSCHKSRRGANFRCPHQLSNSRLCSAPFLT